MAFKALDKAEVIKPVSNTLNWSGKTKALTVDGLSVNVIKVQL